MLVTEIIPFDKKRSKIFIDYEYAFLLYKGEIRNYSLKHGEEISEEIYDEIMKEVLIKRVRLRAMNLLQKMDYTEYKLRAKLTDGCYPKSCIDDALDYVKKYHYIDDNRYAKDYVAYYIDKRSKGRITTDLMKRGIAKDIISSVMEELYENADPNIEIIQARHLLEVKHYDQNSADDATKRKLAAFLYRKGYKGDVIWKALSLDSDDY